MENKPENKNLLKGAATNGTEIDQSVFKIAALAVVGVFFSFVFGYFLKLFFLVGDWNYFLISSCGALGFLILFFLDVFFIKSLKWAGLIILLEVVAMLAGFYDQLSMILALGALVSGLVVFVGHYNGQAEMKNLIRIKFWRVSKTAVPKAVVAVALFVGVAYYLNSEAKTPTNSNEFFISRSSFEKMLAPSVPLVKKLIPEFDLSLSAGDLINKLAQSQVEGNPQAKLLPESSQKQLAQEAARNLEKSASDYLGVDIDMKAKTSDVIYDAIAQRVSGLPENIRNIFQIGLAALIFITIIGFVLPIRWLATSLALIIYEILLALGFAVVSLEGRSKEIIILK